MHIDSSARSKLDAKSKNVTLLVMMTLSLVNAYVMTKTRKLVFNEAILYKDRTSSSEAKKPVVISLKNIPKYEVGKSSGTKD